jgi:hypothetical protein
MYNVLWFYLYCSSVLSITTVDAGEAIMKRSRRAEFTADMYPYCWSDVIGTAGFRIVVYIVMLSLYMLCVNYGFVCYIIKTLLYYMPKNETFYL